MPNLPVVVIFGAENIKLRSAGPVPDYEARDLECYCYLDDKDFYKIIALHNPVSIVSFGNQEDFPNLFRAPYDLRRRWINFPVGSDLDKVGEAAYRCFISDIENKRQGPPLVTVFTPTYKTGDKILRPLKSLLSQNYPDWEWILWDDSDDNGETFKMLSNLASQDSRINVFKSHRHSGVIGEVKRWASMLGRGKYLIELDHDDELTFHAISDVVGAFEKYPDCGFAYSDCAEVFEEGGNRVYGDGWGFGFGSKYNTVYRGIDLVPLRAPLPNPKTVRHIIASPNHLRAWRKDFYESIGGHSRLLHIADDYEMCVRAFLNTKMIQIKRLGYIQYYNKTGNTQFTRNKDIQRLVRGIREVYDRRIHERFLEFDVEDWVWDNNFGASNLNIPNPGFVRGVGHIFE